VANPKKTYDVAAILYNNRKKLIAYLEEFHNEKDSDLQFLEEKKLLIE
jgi:calcium binding protein 39